MVTKKVSSLSELKKLSRDRDFECRILLMGGALFSRKEIRFNPRSGRFHVYNAIGESYQTLTAKNLMDASWTNIGEAITKGALVYDE